MKFDLAREPAPPKQWLPGFVRWPLRWLLWPFVVSDVWIQRLVRPPLPYRIEGKCLQRGDCCRYVYAPIPLKRWRVLRAVGEFYLTQIHGFYLRFDDVYGCRYLRDGRCTHYHLRPAVCRQWAQARYDAPPTLLPGCGFRVVSKR